MGREKHLFLCNLKEKIEIVEATSLGENNNE